MDHTPAPAIRQANGDLLIPSGTVQLLQAALQRLEGEFAQTQGRKVAQTGSQETPRQTAYRQESVDRLSSSVGIPSPTVQEAAMPDTHYTADHTDTVVLLRQLSSLLFPRDPG